MADHYDTLGVPNDATAEAIRGAYRKQASRWHPDRNQSPEAQTRFVAIQAAYECLMDQERRAYYDRTGAELNTQADAQARQLILQAFLQEADRRGWEQFEYVKALRSQFRKEIQKANQAIRQIEQRLDRVDQVMPIAAEGAPENLFQGAVDHAREQLRNHRAGQEQNVERLSLALGLLEPYADNVPAQQVFVTFAAGGTGTSGTAW